MAAHAAEYGGVPPIPPYGPELDLLPRCRMDCDWRYLSFIFFVRDHYQLIAVFANNDDTLCFNVKIAFLRIANNILSFYQIKAAQFCPELELQRF